MGWTEYWATHYKKGQIDRRAECRAYFDRNEKWGTLLKDTMIGSTWYGAVKLSSSGEVFGMVMLTSVQGRNFAYKEMDETMGPYANECPESILKLLSPTDNEYAKQWREKCLNYVRAKKELSKASVVKLTLLHDTSIHNEGDIVYLKRSAHGRWLPAKEKDGEWVFLYLGWYMRTKVIQRNMYEIIK